MLCDHYLSCEAPKSMRAVATKKGSCEKTMGFRGMGALRCVDFGEEFFIGHNPQSADKQVAEKQAEWLEKVLAEEHERDRKHSDRIELPSSCLAGTDCC
jgi:hypothetical protein